MVQVEAASWWVANDSEASKRGSDRPLVLEFCVRQAGHLILFDGRRNPHYVRPLASDNDIRIVAVMNYYTILGRNRSGRPS